MHDITTLHQPVLNRNNFEVLDLSIGLSTMLTSAGQPSKQAGAEVRCSNFQYTLPGSSELENQLRESET